MAETNFHAPPTSESDAVLANELVRKSQLDAVAAGVPDSQDMIDALNGHATQPLPIDVDTVDGQNAADIQSAAELTAAGDATTKADAAQAAAIAAASTDATTKADAAQAAAELTAAADATAKADAAEAAAIAASAPVVHTHTASQITDFNAAADARALTIAQAEVAALIGSAPGTLDTLAEIGDALGDDPNFAATITGLVNAKSGYATGQVGDGATTTTTITHNLNTIRPQIEVWDGEVRQRPISWSNRSVNAVDATWAVAPGLNAYEWTAVG